MIQTTGGMGRLGNQIIRNLAVSLIAEKYNLKVNYYNNDVIHTLGIDLFSGNNVYNQEEQLTDENYFDKYNSGSIMNILMPNNNYFQTKDITNLLYNYLHSEPIKAKIIEKNPYKERYNANNDLFIHIRLTDAERFNPGLMYYLNTIKTIVFNNLYISTDDKTHNIIKTIFESYPAASLIEYDEVNTFQFGSTCKNIILSHGSFSAIIGYLSFYSSIYYAEIQENKIWHGDMFSIASWNKMPIQ